jgi:hypothetical protein
MLECLWKGIFSTRLGVAIGPSVTMKELVEILDSSDKKDMCNTITNYGNASSLGSSNDCIKSDVATSNMMTFNVYHSISTRFERLTKI